MNISASFAGLTSLPAGLTAIVSAGLTVGGSGGGGGGTASLDFTDANNSQYVFYLLDDWIM